MSRIGKRLVSIPDGVTVKVNGETIETSGKNGSLKRTLNMEGLVKVVVENKAVSVQRLSEAQRASVVQGMVRSTINGMVAGVAHGYTRILDMVGVGYKADLKGSVLNISAGFSHPVNFTIPAGLKVTVDKQTRITINGIDKQLVGETASRIRRIRPPEPYQGKGIRYADEHIKRKVGKAAVGTTGG